MLADEPEAWLLKCAVDPKQYARSDVIIAYLALETIERLAAPIAALSHAGVDEARRAGPPLTLRVAPGLTAAFDPGGNESFGTHRCRLIAEAPGGGVDDVLARFAAEGIDPVRPWAREATLCCHGNADPCRHDAAAVRCRAARPTCSSTPQLPPTTR